MNLSLTSESIQAIHERLAKANHVFSNHYPGETGNRQPVHTVYGGAHLFKSDTAKKMGGLAERSLTEFAPDPASFANALGLSGDLAPTIYARVLEKLKREPVEDFRIDFEDGYGNRPDEEEDAHAVQAAQELAKGLKAGTLPPFIGIRIKPFTEELRARSVRTLDIFLTTLIGATDGALPPGFVVTLPKIQIPEQPAALADLFDLLEHRLGLKAGSLKLEMMVETTQAIMGADGRSALPLMLTACRGRCTGAHFGTYDYTASCNITAAHQGMLHPECDFAKHMMKVAFANTGVWLSDGATNIMPIAPHRAKDGGPALTDAQKAENRAVVHRAWKLHFDQAVHSLVTGYYQGWDLHPAQLPTRYAAVYSFFLETIDLSADRLRNFVEKAAQATLVADVFDDAATGQGLLNTFLRGINCGAITEEEAVRRTGLTVSEIRSRSFVQILKGRRGT